MGFSICGMSSSEVNWSESHSAVSYSLQPQGLHSPWNSPGQSIGVSSLSLLQGIFPAQGLEPRSGFNWTLHCRQILYQLSHRGSPRILEWIAYPFSSGSSWPRNQTWVSCFSGRFFTNWTLGSKSTDSMVIAHGLGCSTARGIFLDQGSKPCLLHWEVVFLPLNQQGRP